METNLNKLLATVDRVFKIELMKMPQSLHTTLIKDLMNGTTITEPARPVWALLLILMLFVFIIMFSDDDTSVGEVTMALTVK